MHAVYTDNVSSEHMCLCMQVLYATPGAQPHTAAIFNASQQMAVYSGCGSQESDYGDNASCVPPVQSLYSRVHEALKCF